MVSLVRFYSLSEFPIPAKIFGMTPKVRKCTNFRVFSKAFKQRSGSFLEAFRVLASLISTRRTRRKDAEIERRLTVHCRLQVFAKLGHKIDHSSESVNSFWSGAIFLPSLSKKRSIYGVVGAILFSERISYSGKDFWCDTESVKIHKFSGFLESFQAAFRKLHRSV